MNFIRSIALHEHFVEAVILTTFLCMLTITLFHGDEHAN